MSSWCHVAVLHIQVSLAQNFRKLCFNSLFVSHICCSVPSQCSFPQENKHLEKPWEKYLTVSDTMNHLLTSLAPTSCLSISTTVLTHRENTRKPETMGSGDGMDGSRRLTEINARYLDCFASTRNCSRVPNIRFMIQCFLRPSVKILKY